MRINKEQKKLINILINHKLKDYLYLTEETDPREFFQKYSANHKDLLRTTTQQEREMLERLFRLKRLMLDN